MVCSMRRDVVWNHRMRLERTWYVYIELGNYYVCLNKGKWFCGRYG